MNRRGNLILDKIVDRKKIRLKELNQNLEEIKKIAIELAKKDSFSIEDKENREFKFFKNLKKDGLSIIGEIKKASPSKGLIKENFNPLELGKEYEKCVDAVSILTEEEFFLGSPSYLETVSKNINLPTLRKDFIINEIQIYEAKLLGASAILLIMSILDDTTLKKFHNIANSLNLDVLVESHTEEEVERAKKIGVKIFGINNRNLKTFDVDLNTTIKLSKLIPSDCVLVSESGIVDKDDIKKLKPANIDAILVGETFMKSDNMENLAKELKGAYNE